MEEVPRRTSLVPLAFPCFLHCLIGVETEGLLDYQGGGRGIISIVRWNLRLVIFGVDLVCLKEKLTEQGAMLPGHRPGVPGTPSRPGAFRSFM